MFQFFFRFEVVSAQDDVVTYRMGSAIVKFIVNPLRLEVYQNNELVIIINDFRKFVFEHHRQRPEEM